MGTCMDRQRIKNTKTKSTDDILKDFDLKRVTSQLYHPPVHDGRSQSETLRESTLSYTIRENEVEFRSNLRNGSVLYMGRFFNPMKWAVEQNHLQGSMTDLREDEELETLTDSKEEDNLPQADRLKDYDSIIFKKLNERKFNSKLLKKLGFILYNESTFIILEENFWKSTLFKGSRGFLKMKRNEILIKEALLKGDFKAKQETTPEENKEKWNIAEKASSILREKEILNLLNNISERKHFSECEGSFFKKDDHEITSVLLLTNFGDASLNQIVEKRRIMQKFYPEAEVLVIFRHLISALRILQEARIYHSNIKLSKIFLDVSGNTYIFFDFSFAKLIPKGADPLSQDVFNINEYGRSGSESHISPEKAKAWELLRSSQLSEEHKFNPFKDDLWSLGVCLREVRKFTIVPNGESKLDLILTKMLTEDWHCRPDPIELDDFLKNEMGPNENVNVSEEEKKIAKEIKIDRIMCNSDPRSAYKGLEEAQLIEEQKEFLDVHLEKVSTCKSEFAAWLYFQKGKLLARLGEKQKALKVLEEALTIYKKQLRRNKSLEVAQVHLINFQIYKDFGDFRRASVFIQKALDVQISIANYSTFPEYFNYYGKMWQSIKGNYRTIATTFRERAKLYCIFGQFDRALSEYGRAIETFDIVNKSGANIEAKLEKLRTQMEKYFVFGFKNTELSIKGLMDCIESIKNIFKTNYHLDIAKAHYYIAIQLAEKEDFAQSLINIKTTLNIYSKILKDDHPDVRNALNWQAYLESLEDKMPGNLQLLKELSKKFIKEESQEHPTERENSLELLNQDLEIQSPLTKIPEDEISKALSDYQNLAPINSMTDRIETLAEKNLLTKNFIDNLNIKQYPKKTFKKLALLGKGKFAEVWRGIDLTTRKTVALKFVFLSKNLENLEDNETANLAGLLREQDILDKLGSLKSQCFCELIDIYHLKAESGEISALVLVTTAGDCSLKDLQVFRKRSKKASTKTGFPESPYTKLEVYQILKDLSEALIKLHDLNIYHSDIKPDNIVYNADLKKYQLIDFGVSRVIEFKDQLEVKFGEECLVPMEQYANGGTRKYFSPEKKKYWSEAKNFFEMEEEDQIDSNIKENIFSMVFDPFKCDIYSLGKTVSDLLSRDEMEDFIPEMICDDYKLRISAKDLHEKASKQVTQLSNNDPESNYLDLIEKNRWKSSFLKFYKKYDRAFMPVEQLALVEEELRQASESPKEAHKENQKENQKERPKESPKESHKGSPDESKQESQTAKQNSSQNKNETSGHDQENMKKIIEIKFRRGLTLKKLGNLTEAKTQFLEILHAQESFQTQEKEKYALSNTLLALASIYSERGEFKKTMECLDMALKIRKEIYLSDNHPEVLKVLQEQAIQKGNFGDYGWAADKLQNILDSLNDSCQKSINKSSYAAITNVMLEQAKQWSHMSQYSRAINQLETVLSMRMDFLGTEIHPDVVEVMYEIAKLNIRRRNFDDEKNVKSLERILYLKRSLYKSDSHPSIAESIYTLAQVKFYRGENEKALSLFKEVIENYKKIYRSYEHPSLFCAKVWYDYIFEHNDMEIFSINEIPEIPIFARENKQSSTNRGKALCLRNLSVWSEPLSSPDKKEMINTDPNRNSRAKNNGRIFLYDVIEEK